MPKTTTSPKTRSQITADSDERRGIKAKTYKLKTEVIAEIAALSDKLGISQAEVIAQAVALLGKSQ